METNDRPRLSNKSSVLCQTPSLIFLAIAAVVAKLIGSAPGCAFFTGFFLLFAFCRIWAELSLKNVQFSLKADRYCLFPGSSLQVELVLHNNKLLPLVWAELVQYFLPNACLLPEEELTPVPDTEAMFEGLSGHNALVYKKRFSLVLWGQSIQHSYSWQAKRRGLYSPNQVLLRSGDGIGLCHIQLPVASLQNNVFAVYPALQPVNTSLFLRNVWRSQNSGKGNMEDPTLLRSTRAYLPGDPVKKINWRMAAMGLPLEVNVQETIMPHNAHFVVDGESFCGPNARSDLLEDVLSIVASLIFELENAGVKCGLSLPEGEAQPPKTTGAFSEHSAEDLLFSLAAYNTLAPTLNDEGKINVPKPSIFDSAAVNACLSHGEKLYYFTLSPDLRAGRSAKRILENGALPIYCLNAQQATSFPGISLDTLKGGAVC